MTGIDEQALVDIVESAVARAMPGWTIGSAERLTGGASSITFGVVLARDDAESQRVVVKMAPPGLPPNKNRDVLRQARVLRALDRSGVPVPRVLGVDAGDPPTVPPLFIMTYEEGNCIEPLTHGDAAELPDAVTVRGRALHSAELMGELHSVPWQQVGLDSETPVPLADEIERWVRAFETVPADLADGSGAVANLLTNALPEERSHTLVHGDFRLGNMLCVGPRVTAVVDWETWCVGDPRIDVGWLLMNADSSAEPHAVRRDAGIPTRAELVATYAARTGSEPDDLDWFVALSQFRAAAMVALILKHDRRRAERNPFVSWWDPDVPRDFTELARQGLSRSGHS